MKIIRYFFLLICFAFLTYATLHACPLFAQDSEDFTPTDTFTDIFDTGSNFEEGPSLDSVAEDLDSIIQDLSSELEDTPSKALKAIVNKLNKVLDTLDNAATASDDEDLKACDMDLSQADKLLSSTVKQFERRQCKEGSTSKRCISIDIVDSYLEDMQTLADDLDEVISIDDDEDGIPDECGFAM